MSSKRLAVVLQGVKSVDQVPGLEAAGRDVEWRCAPTADDLSEMLPGAEVLLGWDFRASELRAAWGQADRLRWIQWSGAGVDALLFPELVSSDVVLTNARGVFDRAMAESVLGFMLSFAKGFTETFRAQAERRWNYRWTEQLMGREVLIVGVGSIGREIARLLSAAGLKVQGVGRSARTGDADFGIISAVSDLDQCLAQSDYVVAIPPLTPDTHGLFGAKQFASMKKQPALCRQMVWAVTRSYNGCAGRLLGWGQWLGSSVISLTTPPKKSNMHCSATAMNTIACSVSWNRGWQTATT